MYTHSDVEVPLRQQGAQMIVEIMCDFVHLISVGVHRKHALSTVRDLCVVKTHKKHIRQMSNFNHNNFTFTDFVQDSQRHTNWHGANHYVGTSPYKVTYP